MGSVTRCCLLASLLAGAVWPAQAARGVGCTEHCAAHRPESREMP